MGSIFICGTKSICIRVTKNDFNHLIDELIKQRFCLVLYQQVLMLVDFHSYLEFSHFAIFC